MSARIEESHSPAIPVIVDVDRELVRELLARAIHQQTDLESVPFDPTDGHQYKYRDLAVCEKLRQELNDRPHCDVFTVITSVEQYGDERYQHVCGRWLHEFPELFVIVVSIEQGTITTFRNEVREERIPNSLDNILNAIRETASR